MKYNTDYLASKKATTETPATPAIPTPVEHAVAQGPAGYSQAMLMNLGLLPQQMQSPGPSGMTQGTPYWYDPTQAPTPAPAVPNPLAAIFGSIPLPEAPPTPDPATTPAPTTPTRTVRKKPAYNWGGND